MNLYKTLEVFNRTKIKQLTYSTQKKLWRLRKSDQKNEADRKSFWQISVLSLTAEKDERLTNLVIAETDKNNLYVYKHERKKLTTITWLEIRV